jgi:hypothetical protein
MSYALRRLGLARMNSPQVQPARFRANCIDLVSWIAGGQAIGIAILYAWFESIVTSFSYLTKICQRLRQDLVCGDERRITGLSASTGV